MSCLQALGGAVREGGEARTRAMPERCRAAAAAGRRAGAPGRAAAARRRRPGRRGTRRLVGARVGTVRARAGPARGRAGRRLVALVARGRSGLRLLGLLAVPLLLVPLGWLGLLGLFRPLGRPGSFGLLDRARLFGSGSRVRPPLVLPLSRRLLPRRTLGRRGRFGRGAGGADGQRLRGARLPWRRRTLLLGRLFLISYHQSPSGRWWHGRPVEGGIRVHSGGRGKWIILPAPGLSAPCRRPPGGAGPCVRSHCRCRAAGWTE